MDKPRETLRAQYEKMFSTPLLQNEVKDPEAFFAPVYNCMDCDNKITHFFPLDLEPEKRNLNLQDVDKITINPVVIMNIMEKLEQWPVDQTEFQPYCQRIVLNHWQSQSRLSCKPALTSDRTQLD